MNEIDDELAEIVGSLPAREASPDLAPPEQSDEVGARTKGFARQRGSTWTAYWYDRHPDGGRWQRSKGGFATRRDALDHAHRAYLMRDFVQECAVRTITVYASNGRCAETWPVDYYTRHRLLKAAEFRWMICHTRPEPGDMPLEIDHCHDTNYVRGVLCHSCNVGLGWFRDRVDLLYGAIGYLTAAMARNAEQDSLDLGRDAAARVGALIYRRL